MLVTKQQLLAAVMASADETRWNITHLKIERRATGPTTLATNGHMAVRVRSKELPAQGDVPECPRQSGSEPQLGEAVHLHAAPALESAKAMPTKTNLPGFQLGRLLVEGVSGRVSIGGTDGLTHKIVLADQPEGIVYPGVQSLIAQAEERVPIAKIVLSAKYLKMIAQYAQKFAALGTPAVKLTFYGHDQPVLFEWQDPRHEVTGVLMPMRLEEPAPPLGEGPGTAETVLRAVDDATMPGTAPLQPATMEGVEDARAQAALNARTKAAAAKAKGQGAGPEPAPSELTPVQPSPVSA